MYIPPSVNHDADDMAAVTALAFRTGNEFYIHFHTPVNMENIDDSTMIHKPLRMIPTMLRQMDNSVFSPSFFKIKAESTPYMAAIKPISHPKNNQIRENLEKNS